MEFIIIGLFILFFSYILLYSLYDIYFKSYGNIVEGLTTEDDTASSKSSSSSPASSKSKSSPASESASASADEKGTSALNQSDNANSQISTFNAKHTKMTFSNATALNKKHKKHM